MASVNFSDICRKLESMKRMAFLTCLVACFTLQLFAQTEYKPYKVLKTIKIGGSELKWDYLTFDKASNRLFVSNNNCVQVVNLTTDKVVGKIKNLKDVHGIAISPDFGKGFITEGGTDSIAVFDLKSLKITRKIKSLGRNPDAIFYDFWTKKVFVFNTGSFSVITIDPASEEVNGMLMLPGNPRLAVSDNMGKVYVNLESVSGVVKIDAWKLQIIGMYALGEKKGPTGLAYDNKNKFLMAAGRESNQLMISDINSGDLVDSVEIGGRCEGVALMLDTREIFTSNGDGTMTIIHQENPNKYTVTQTLATKYGARTMAYDESTKRFYLPYAEFDKVKQAYVPGSFGILVVGR
jgi:DNA-binding beta-propeller fold protein YncE